MKLSAVIIENVILCVVEEECPIIGLSFSFLEQAFHCVMNFRVEKEGSMLGFKDQFKGSDDKV